METHPPLTLSIGVPSGPFDFDDSEVHSLAILGKVWTALSAYEYSCDDFIFAVAEHHAGFVVSHRLDPAHNSDKERQKFILTALAHLDALRDLAGIDGKPDLEVIKELMGAIWTHRVQLAHGRLWSSGDIGLGLEFNFAKWSRLRGAAPNTFQHTTFSYSQAKLGCILEDISYVRAMLAEARRMAMGELV